MFGEENQNVLMLNIYLPWKAGHMCIALTNYEFVFQLPIHVLGFPYGFVIRLPHCGVWWSVVTMEP